MVVDGPESAAHAALEQAASFGQWWYDSQSGLSQLSPVAADFLDVRNGAPDTLDACLTHVLEEDLPEMVRLWTQRAETPQRAQEIRVLGRVKGLRWLRVTPLPADPERPRWLWGVLQDVTALKHAAVLERLGFELTEYLVGTHTLRDAITNVIQLICKNLGWEWGAYWSAGTDTSSEAEARLSCGYFWHPPNQNLKQFSAVSAALSMAPGEGLVGRVWVTGEAQWVEDMSTDPRFLRRTSAHLCGLWSGYVFPVNYVSDNGEQHRPGVLEFYSRLARQPEAQLPKVSATIGALIAQTAQRLETEAAIHRLAHIDELTDLDNRAHFYAQLNRQCASGQRGRFALIFIDLDRFKPINDAFGHAAGNAVLQEFARRLKALAPAAGRVGRLGGDEFAVMVPDDGDDAALVDEVQKAACRSFSYEGIELTVSASIGVSRFPENGQTGPELLRSADAAMYRVKQNGRNGSNVFSTSSPDTLALQRARLAQRLAIETELHLALQHEQLGVVYQPIFELATGRLYGAEALVRWYKPNGETVPPDVFIPIAEQSELIVDIGRWVIGQALRDLAAIKKTALGRIKVHVNMAATEFTSSALPGMLLDQATRMAVPTSQLVLELTESMLMRQPDQVMPVMHHLRQLGFEISLDDFGMGHSSLSMLKSLPMSSLKIDRSFVRDLASHESDRAIAQTVVDLGRHLQLEVIAEGIERPEQLHVLRAVGCQFGQGFLLGRPQRLEVLLASFPDGRPATDHPLHGVRHACLDH